VDKIIAKWESKSHKWFAVLYEHTNGAYSYSGASCGGSLGIIPRQQAIDLMQSRVDQGYFQPDANKTPMRRVL